MPYTIFTPRKFATGKQHSHSASKKNLKATRQNFDVPHLAFKPSREVEDPAPIAVLCQRYYVKLNHSFT